MSNSARFYRFLATGFYSGLAPRAPGTFGTLAALALGHILQLRGAEYWLAGGVSLALGLFITHQLIAAGVYSADERGKVDPGEVVIDEFAGLYLALGGTSGTIPELILGFILFRFFDITKIAPARQLERLGGAAGIMLDDVMAGIYACAVLQLIYRILL